MQDQVRLAVKQAFPRSRDCLEMKVQRVPGQALKNRSAGQALLQGTKDHLNDAQLAFLAHRELCSVSLQTLQRPQQLLRRTVKRTSGFSHCDTVAASVQKFQSNLLFELTNGRKHRWMGAMQLVSRSLEAFPRVPRRQSIASSCRVNLLIS